MSARRPTPSLFTSLSSTYLRMLGELHVCATRLRALDPSGLDDSWRRTTQLLLEQSDALAERLSRGHLSEHGLTLPMPDGSVIAADTAYVQRLVRRMSYQLEAADVGTASARVREFAELAS
jgi:hypothetical protein